MFLRGGVEKLPRKGAFGVEKGWKEGDVGGAWRKSSVAAFPFGKRRNGERGKDSDEQNVSTVRTVTVFQIIGPGGGAKRRGGKSHQGEKKGRGRTNWREKELHEGLQNTRNSRGKKRSG